MLFLDVACIVPHICIHSCSVLENILAIHISDCKKIPFYTLKYVFTTEKNSSHSFLLTVPELTFKSLAGKLSILWALF